MDDARRWTAAAPGASADAPAAIQPGDPWGAPAWGPDPRAAGVPNAVPGTPAGVWRRGAALAVDLIVAAILWKVGTQLAFGLTRVAPRLDLVAEAFGRTWQLVVPVAYFVLSHGTSSTRTAPPSATSARSGAARPRRRRRSRSGSAWRWRGSGGTGAGSTTSWRGRAW
jgi:hypothetical protein